jgi:hypothetical protein
MSRRTLKVVAEYCGLALAVCFATFFATPAYAQAPEVKEKPPMYSYVSFWTIPRAQWGELEKSNMANQKILEKALAGGTLVGYGNDTNLIHQSDGPTHDSWWSSTSMAGLLNILDEFHKAGTSTSPVLVSSTKHSDGVFVSRFYNWRAGTYKDAYTHGSSYKLKADAGDDAVEMLSKSMLVPLLEKLLADGTILEYEVDVEAIHTEAPGTFWIFYLTPNAEGIDKSQAAVRAALKANPMMGPTFGSVTETSGHRDYLSRTNATYK